MPKTRTLAEAFSFFGGAKAVNPRWGWAAQTVDERTVVLALWSDRMIEDHGETWYRALAVPGKDEWIRLPGNKDRIRKLQHVRAHCADIFHAVLVTAVKTADHTRRTRGPYNADEKHVMKLEDFNEVTGEFAARRIELKNA